MTESEESYLISQDIPDWRAVLEFQVANGEHFAEKSNGWQRTPRSAFRNASAMLAGVMTAESPLPEIFPDGRGFIGLSWSAGAAELSIIAGSDGFTSQFTRNGAVVENDGGSEDFEQASDWLGEISELAIERSSELRNRPSPMIAAARSWLDGQIRNQAVWRAESTVWERLGHQGPWGLFPEDWPERLGKMLWCRRCGCLIYQEGRATVADYSPACIPVRAARS